MVKTTVHQMNNGGGKLEAVSSLKNYVWKARKKQQKQPMLGNKQLCIGCQSVNMGNMRPSAVFPLCVAFLSMRSLLNHKLCHTSEYPCRCSVGFKIRPGITWDSLQKVEPIPFRLNRKQFLNCLISHQQNVAKRTAWSRGHKEAVASSRLWLGKPDAVTSGHRSSTTGAPREDWAPAAGRPNLSTASDPPAPIEPSDKWELESTAQALSVPNHRNHKVQEGGSRMAGRILGSYVLKGGATGAS